MAEDASRITCCQKGMTKGEAIMNCLKNYCYLDRCPLRGKFLFRYGWKLHIFL